LADNTTNLPGYMTTDFQLGLLRYLVQEPDGVEYILDIEEDIFDLVQYQIALQILKKYYRLYNITPGRIAAQQFLEEEITDTTDLSKDVANSLRDTFVSVYEPLSDNDKVKLQDTLVIQIQEKHIDNIFTDYADNRLSPDQLILRINKVASFVKTPGIDLYADGSFLARDRSLHYDDQVEGNPTFLHDLNMLTSARGFYSPQLIVFMSGPKHFKTGFMIILAVEYARDGYSVYYADGENGARSIRNRAKQTLMGCTLSELFDPAISTELDDTLMRWSRNMGGDIFIEGYPSYMKTPNDVRGRLQFLKDEHGFIPDIIFWDSIDHFIPSNPVDQKRDTRIQIQKVYHEVINLNKQLGCFSFAPSQVNRKAVNKKTFDMTDLSEDFGKAMNAHAVFAICGTPDEIDMNIRRIIPVVQREGVAYKGRNMCLVQVDEERQIVEELDKEAYLEGVEDD